MCSFQFDKQVEVFIFNCETLQTIAKINTTCSMPIQSARISFDFEYLIILFKDKFKSSILIFELKNFSLIKSISRKEKINDFVLIKYPKFKTINPKTKVEKSENWIEFLFVCKH